MKLNELLVETELIIVTKHLLEAPEKQNATVAKWANIIGWQYSKLHKLWDKAAENKGKNYFAISGTFKKILSSILNKTERSKLEKAAGIKFNFEKRTHQTFHQATDDKPAPKSTNLAFRKRNNAKIKKLSDEIKILKSKNITALRKNKIAKLMKQKKELQSSLKQ